MAAKEMKSFRLSSEVLELLESESESRDRSVTSILENCVKEQLGGESVMKLQQLIKLLKKEELVQESGNEEILTLKLTGRKVELVFSSDKGDFRTYKEGDDVKLNREFGAFVSKRMGKKEYIFVDSIFYFSIEKDEK